MPYTNSKPIIDVVKERERQDEKWGIQLHNPIEWIAVLTEEVGEASQEALRWRFRHEGEGWEQAIKDFRKELIHCAAVAVAAIECLDRSYPPEN